MIDIILNKEKELKYILNDFFRKKYQRNSIPEFSIDYDQKVLHVACQIFKRGFIKFENELTSLSQSIPLQFLEKLQLEHLLQKKNIEKIFYIVDFNIYTYYASLLQTECVFLYKASELNKNIDTVIAILRYLPRESTKIFAIGGGNTLDVSGFVAAIAKLPVVYVATTLLATVDAATGGKTGVNHPLFGKNQIGLFYNANEFYCVPDFFQTLPFAEIISGLCEALKHAWLYGSFEDEESIFAEILQSKCSFDKLKYFLLKNITYKTNIIALDPFEKKGIRSALNFGHTLAHIIEALAEDNKIDRMSHGIAVAHGMYFLIKNNIIECQSKSFLDFLMKIINLYPIVKFTSIDISDVEHYLKQDKKNINSFECSLSLPAYGMFSLSVNEVGFIDILKNTAIDHFALLTSQYLNSFNIHS